MPADEPKRTSKLLIESLVGRIDDYGEPVMNIARSSKVAIFIAFLAISTFSLAQTPDDRAAVERAALNYLEGFYEGSTEKLRQSVHPDVHKFGFYLEDGTYKSTPMSFDEMLAYAEEVKTSGNYPDDKAPKSVEVLEVLNQTAVAKVYAWWGSDYMTLAKYDGNWMIVQVLWQQEPED